MVRGLLNYARRYLAGGSLERRRVRYEIGLRLRGVDVSGVELDALGFSADRSKPHSPSGGPDLEDVLSAIGAPRDAAALDLGCGKGVAMLTLGRYFRRVDGADLSPGLLEVAARNLEKCGIRGSLIHADAAEFDAYDSYSVVYMFNPFPDPVMRIAMRNLARSLGSVRRPFWLIYKNPKYDSAVTAAGFRAVREFPGGELPYRVYRLAE
jgi:SAM-dependent methyltransferase